MRLWSGAWGGATVRQRVGLCSQDDMRRGQLANCVVGDTRIVHKLLKVYLDEIN